MHRLLRGIIAAAALAALGSSADAQTFNQLAWGRNWATTPATACILNGASCAPVNIAVGTSIAPVYANSVTVTGTIVKDSSTITGISAGDIAKLVVGQQIFSGNFSVGGFIGTIGASSVTMVPGLGYQPVVGGALCTGSPNPCAGISIQFGQDRWSTTSNLMVNSIGAQSVFAGAAAFGNTVQWLNRLIGQVDYGGVNNPMVSVAPVGGIGHALIVAARASDVNGGGGVILPMQLFCYHNQQQALGTGCQYTEGDIDTATTGNMILHEYSMYNTSITPLFETPDNINGVNRLTLLRYDCGKGVSNPLSLGCSAFQEFVNNNGAALAGSVYGLASITAGADSISPVRIMPPNYGDKWYNGATLTTVIASTATTGSLRWLFGNANWSVADINGAVTYLSQNVSGNGGLSVGPANANIIGISGAANGSTPKINVGGVNTDISFLFAPKNAGLITFQDGTDNTKQAAFQLNGITAGNTRTLTVPDASGTIQLTGSAILCAQMPALLVDVTSTAGTCNTALATAQPAVHTWALAQTFTVAPAFTDQSGSRTALGLGTAATQATGTSGATLPFLNGTNTWSGVQTFTNSDIALLGSSTGATTFTSDNSGASNFTAHVPAANDTFAMLAAAQSLSNKTLASPVITGAATGGSTASSSLTLQSTSGVGTSDFIDLLVGNNGAKRGLRVDTNGQTIFGGTTYDTGIAAAAGNIQAPLLALEGAVPDVIWKATGSGVDAKYWDQVASGNTLLFRALNDAFGSTNTWATVTRSGFTIAGITFSTSSGTVTLPLATDTLVGKATTDTFTHKTYDTAGTGNSFSINGVAATDNTGTGAVARATSPTFVAPTLGAATATTINLVTLTQPATAATLTIANNASLITSGAFALTLTATAATNSTLPSGTHTLAGLDVAQTFTAVQSYNSGNLKHNGATSGALTINCAATCGTSTLTFPGATFDFSASGGTSQVVKQTSSGGAFSVAQLAFSDLSDATAWAAYTPAAPISGTGTVTTFGSVTAVQKQYGKLVCFQQNIPITTNGTGATNIIAGLPFQAASTTGGYVIGGRETGVSGKMLQGIIASGGSTVTISNYDNTYPGANSAILTVSGCYQSV